MGKLLLHSIQNKDVVDEICKGVYTAQFSKSLGCKDNVSVVAYKYMLDSLARKTDKSYRFGVDTGIWSWYKNPYLDNCRGFNRNTDDLYVISHMADEEDVVLSDFDLWNKMFIDEEPVNSIVRLANVNEGQSIQAISWGIKKEDIIIIEKFNDFERKQKK